MATLRIRHLVTKRRKGGAPVYFYSATPAMRKIGIFSEALGVSLSIAVKRAEELNTACGYQGMSVPLCFKL